MQPAIVLEGVDRSFGDVAAISSLTLTVPVGSVTVLLGPNGAGKTTTVRLITGALRPDAGRVRVHGLDPSIDGTAVRSRCGVVPPKPAMYERLTGWENLAYAADLYDVGRDGIAAAAGRFGIAGALDQDVAGYSTGMRTRLALARAFLHDPDVLLLDEPTAGLDPESARDVLNLISKLATTGRTIVMCTHLLHEAEGIADQVALMVRGSARVVGHPNDLADQYFSQPRVVLDAEDRTALRRVADHPEVVAAEWNGGLEVALTSLRHLPDLVAALVADGTRLTRVEPRTGSLADLYFEMQRIHGGEESNWKRVFTVAKTDLRQLFKSRDYWGPLIVIAVLFFAVIPTIVLTGVTRIENNDVIRQVSDLLGSLPASLQEDVAGLTPAARAAYALSVYLLAPIAIVVPLTVSSAVGAHAIVGERERGTGEFLAHSPASMREVYVGKLIGSLVPGYLATLGGFAIYSLVVNGIAGPEMGGWFFPTVGWWLLILWVLPPFLAVALAIIVWLSGRMRSTAASQQAASLVSLPVIILAYGIAGGIAVDPTRAAIGIGGAAWIAAAVTLTFGARMFDRERLLGVGS